MSKEKRPIHEGYQPKNIEKKGYQPERPVTPSPGDPKPKGGYIPTSEGDSPSNPPSPPGDE